MRNGCLPTPKTWPFLRLILGVSEYDIFNYIQQLITKTCAVLRTIHLAISLSNQALDLYPLHHGHARLYVYHQCHCFTIYTNNLLISLTL
jgi:hypothetical protein